MRKIIGIFILILLIVTTIPIVNSADKNVSSQISNEGYVVDECGCGSNSGSGIGIMKKSIHWKSWKILVISFHPGERGRPVSLKVLVYSIHSARKRHSQTRFLKHDLKSVFWEAC